jgi:hypothetical protein
VLIDQHQACSTKTILPIRIACMASEKTGSKKGAKPSPKVKDLKPRKNPKGGGARISKVIVDPG